MSRLRRALDVGLEQAARTLDDALDQAVRETAERIREDMRRISANEGHVRRSFRDHDPVADLRAYRDQLSGLIQLEPDADGVYRES